MDLAEPAPRVFLGSQGWLSGKTDGAGTSIPCRALVYQEAPGPSVSNLSMYLLERRCGSTLRRVDRPSGITRARWHVRGHGSTHSDHTPAFHHRQVPCGAS